MKAITVRNLPPPVARAIQDKARREKKSLNRVVVSLLEEATGHGPAKGKKSLHHDLDKYAGVWTTEEADEFDAHLRQVRRVDPKDWE